VRRLTEAASVLSRARQHDDVSSLAAKALIQVVITPREAPGLCPCLSILGIFLLAAVVLQSLCDTLECAAWP